ncbi:MAG: Omp28-related outer membrane protein [Bacteroidetes bacterium]|nr:Omp28-related outer membrane protein [Bacteroidota bacterium]
MKKNRFLLLLTFTCSLFIFSCKKDNNSGGGTGNATTALTLSLSSNTINLSNPQPVTVTVVNQSGADVTSQCAIKVNGVVLYSSTYTPSSVGSFTFVATKDSITSNTSTLTVTNSSTSSGDSLYVSLSTSTIQFNDFDYTTITVNDKNGTDITSTCQLLVDGAGISSRNYVGESLGNHNITAQKGSTPSTSKVLSVVTATPSPFTQKLLVEDATGAWCGFCTRIANSLENYKSNHPNCIVVAIHGGGGTDPYKYQYYTNFNSTFGVTAYPTAIVNRSGTWSENASELNTALTKWAPLGLAIESSVSGTNITGKAKVKFNVTTNKSMKIIVALVENGLVFPQTNYYSPSSGYTPYLYGGANPISNFTHNGVMRRAATNLFGDAIPSTSQLKNNIYELAFTIPTTGVTSSGANFTVVPANCSIVAYVVDGTSNNKGVYNVQSATVGTVKNFD